MRRSIKPTRKLLAGVAAAATIALSVLGAGVAQAAPDGGKGSEGNRALRAPLSESLAPDRAAHAKVTASPAATAALATVQQRIKAYVTKNGTDYTFGSYLDSSSGKIVLETNAPASVVNSLLNLSGASSAQALVAKQAQVRRTTVSDKFNRRDDISPFWGAAGLYSGGALCSSGYAVQSGGFTFMTTAGHCYADGSSVLTESGANVVGTVVGRRLPTVTGGARDMELLWGGSYSGRTYTGGVLSTSSAPVVAAGTAYVGYTNYCHSGRTTGENCGHTATSISGQVCTATGCKSPVIVFNGGVQPAGGDSGGAFYAKDSAGGVWIRGHILAGDGTTSYAEPWLELQAEYGVGIVLG